ncbi:TcfC E-set like domain-containing protein [Aeromonas hydrophila]|uniref:TcfC E-set like domain-containing protein n=1 Tax=Aeromonas hydrophila TaxID=644 RepID=UPI001303DDA8|nr:CS1-pili formation C-terminal domain-containing protein [Aeromonas hydrophila]QGZ71100.1 fimbrial biogenesis outer membrane usher protein [Aeromonas hydrophila]
MKSVILKRSAVAMAFLLALPMVRAESQSPQRLGNVLIPSSFASALRDGLSVPVQLRYQDTDAGTDTLTDDPVGNATLVLKDKSIYLLNMDFSAGKGQGLLNDTLIAKLAVDDDRPFNDEGQLVINDDATIHIDLMAMLLTIEVARSAFSRAKQAVKEDQLAPSVDDLTSVHSYNFGYSFSNNDTGYFDSNYLQLVSTVSLGADHLLLDGSLYNLGKEGQDGQVYRAMYERDLNDHRMAAGMVSTWDLQTLGMVTALNSGRIYGASYGNQAQSRKRTADQSTTPVQVFMPANGEVRVYRDGRLIALQNLNIGNQNIDSTSFPGGVYSVTVEVYVNGRLTDTSTQRVTKLGSGNQFVGYWGWQWWGGWMESTSEEQINSPLLGTSFSRTVGDLTYSGTSYAFNQAVVAESGIQWQAHEQVNLAVQTMAASDNSWRAGSNISVQPIDNVSLWASQEKLSNGSRLSLSESNLYSLGLNLNLGGWLNGLGQLSFNTTHDKEMGSTRSYLDYYQHLYSGRYGNLSMRTSVQSSNDDSFGNRDNKSITLDYSLPLGQLLSLGMSSNEQGQTIANLNYQQQLEGVVNQTSLNVQRVMNGDEQGSPTLSGTLGFEHQLIGGTSSLSRNNRGDLNGNLIARGAIATTGEHLAVSSKGEANAGVLIDTGLSGDGQMLAKVNGQDYPLQGEKSFLALHPYQEYEIELLNSKTSMDSYEINTGKQRYTLFPGNVATLDARNNIKEMVTVFGVIKAEDGSLLTNARLNNHIGSTVTNEAGEFSLDVDKANPMLMFHRGSDFCEAELNIEDQAGAAWVGVITCKGLPTYAMVTRN